MPANYKAIAKNLKFEGRAFINGKYVNAIDGKKFESTTANDNSRYASLAVKNTIDVDKCSRSCY